MAKFQGTSADDIYAGTSMGDTIVSGGGKDTLGGAGGNDTIVLDAALVAGSIIDGGDGTDTLALRNFATQPLRYTPLSPQGMPATNYQVVESSFSSIERIAFESTAGSTLIAVFRFGEQSPGSPYTNQFASGGVAATAELVGGAGHDILNLVGGIPSGDTITAPSFSYVDWETPTRAYQGGDRVNVSTTSAIPVTINGSPHVGVQFLRGGSGSDTINGSNDMDYIEWGGEGGDKLYGNGGDDTIGFVETIMVTTGSDGQIVKETSLGRSAQGLVDGGAGFDFVLFGGTVVVATGFANIEGMYLSPHYTPPLAPNQVFTRQDPTVVTIGADRLADLPVDLLFDGVGTMVIGMTVAVGSGYTGSIGTLDISHYRFDKGSDIDLIIEGSVFADTVVGSNIGDRIDGRESDDLITGGLGEDLIDGGSGKDIAIFRGNRSAYAVDEGAAGNLTVVGPDGTDTLSNIEILRFADGDFGWDAREGDIKPIEDIYPRGTFRVFAGNGFGGEVGGHGTVFGTNEFQAIELVGEASSIALDPSFNRGGDVVMLPGPASDYSATLVGSSVIISAGLASHSIPVGTAGTFVAFANDDVRTLYFDASVNYVRMGPHRITDQAYPLFPWYEAGAIPVAEDPAATARAFLSTDAEIIVGGRYTVFGTAAGHEQVTWRWGDIALDPSFNRGGDTLIVDGAAEEFSAYLNGSSLMLQWDGKGTAAVPIGTEGLTVEFASDDGIDARELIYDASAGKIVLGDQTIVGTSAMTADQLLSANTASFG